MRVVVIGAECTGKTTLAHALARHYSAPCVEEYAREYSLDKIRRGELGWFEDEFLHLVEVQLRREEAATADADDLVVCDTDAFGIWVWHPKYLPDASESVKALALPRRADLYVLAAPDIPLVADGVREEESNRDVMHVVFERALVETERPFVLAKGDHRERLATAIAAVDALCAR